MKLLTFLGATTPYETSYYLPDGREHTAPFCGVALARFFPDTDMRVFVTEDAQKMHWDRFRSLAEDHVASLLPVPIPDGKDEAQLWDVFQAVVDHVATDDSVVFDITHGFRSLPFLSFLAAAYLRVVKKIRLQAVLYGNFEARDKSVTPNRAPVIDLTRFVDLLDWMVAADRFVRFGDAHDLAERLRAAKPGYPQIEQDPRLREDDKRLGLAARALDDVSLALRLIRPAEAMEASHKLQTRLVDATQSLQTHARPFLPLAQSVSDAFAPLSLSRVDQDRNPVDLLARERRMVFWYLERRQYVQAMAVAREWIITWAMMNAGMGSVLDKDLREEMEQTLGRANKERQAGSGAFSDTLLSSGRSLHSIPKIAQALRLYEEVGHARNDLLHAGKRPDAKEAEVLERMITSLCSRLNELPLPE
ncbi:MAG: TIGR02221 family CRISPR-associated protein [Anaerolineae bacterium]|nr:TIGR02221 family CRISPR-associated protein [Anaerolineae bacterium]